jgi:DNA-binding transcriptional LysR family regulator
VQWMDHDLRRLRCFVTVAELLHFRRAAARLSISCSALTQQINRLETSLDCRLFDRTSRCVRLSENGRALLPLARDVLAANDRLGLFVAGEPQPSRSTLRVGYSSMAPGPLMRPFVKELARALEPQHRVAVQQYADHEPSDAVLRGEVDAAFARDPLPAEGIRTRVVFVEARVAVLSRDHPLADEPAVALADLDDDVFIPMSSGTPEWVEQWLCRPRAELGSPVSSFDEMRQRCALRAGVGIAPASISRLYAHPQVAYVPLKDVGPTRVVLCTREDADLPALRVLENVARRVVAAACRTQRAQRLPEAAQPVAA